MRHIYRAMSASPKEIPADHKLYALLSFIEKRLEEIGKSERAVLEENNIEITTIRNIRKKGTQPGIDKIEMLSAALDVPFETLANLARTRSNSRVSDFIPRSIHAIPLLGNVQAGAFHTAYETPIEDREYFSAPGLAAPKNAKVYALRVKGNSMNLVYPDGVIIFVVSYQELNLTPMSGDKVVILRRAPDTADFEATVKEFHVGPYGLPLLWPRSTEPEHQKPIALSTDMQFGEWGQTPESENDILILGKVIGSLQQEPTNQGQHANIPKIPPETF